MLFEKETFNICIKNFCLTNVKKFIIHVWTFDLKKSTTQSQSVLYDGACFTTFILYTDLLLHSFCTLYRKSHLCFHIE